MVNNSEGSPESAFRLWGEERDDDIVYSVYLKKVSYKKSAEDASCVQHDCCPDSSVPRFLSYLQWETLRIRTIKAASVQRLVEYLPMAVEDMDSVYINVFLSTYQTFTTLKEALGMLLKRYIEVQETATESEKDRQLKNIRSVVMMWLEENHDDFREPPDYPCLHMIEEFARDVSQDVELHLRTQLLMTSFENEDSPKKLHVSPDERPKFQFSLSDEVDFMMLGRMGYHDIREIDSQLIAEQLTQMEADLFRKVIPQHCLGSIWSRRDKKHGVDPTTVAATVNQFNDITMRVMSTIVEDKSLRPMGRGLIITKWIDVAQSCRELKNFSALKAIISALQSHPIHRLRRSWSAVPKASTILFEDLANIFLDDNNFETWREIINKEGTAKFATVSPRSSKKVTRSLRKMMSSDKLVVQRRDSWHGKVNGTVPYLGTFLSDLIKIDTAYPDTVEDGLINFEKKRKEFEVIAQIRLLQMSSKSYQIQPDDKFMEWFNDMKVLSYQECCKLSDELQSPNMMTSSAPNTPTLVKTEKTKTYSPTKECSPRSARQRLYPHFQLGNRTRPMSTPPRPMSMLLTPKHSPNDPDVSPETRPPSRSVSDFMRPLFPSLCSNLSSLSPPRTCPNPGFLLAPLIRRKFFSFTAEDFKHRTSTNSTMASRMSSTTNSNTNSSNGEEPCRARTGPDAKNHSSTSSISSSSSSTPSSDDSMSIASIDSHLPASSNSSSSTSSSSTSSSSTASGSTSLSMSTTSSSSSAETASRDSSLLSAENSPAKSARTLKTSLSMTCLSTLERRSSLSPTCASPPIAWEFPSQSCRIIRVGLDETLQQKGDGNIYRSLVITHQEHTPSIIKNALTKHHIQEPWDYHDFELIQLLDEKELLIPADANVFYAMNTAAQPHFLLRKKVPAGEEPSTGTKKKSVRGGSQKGSKRLHIKRMSWVKVREEAR